MKHIAEYIILKELALESILLNYSSLNLIKDSKKGLIFSSYRLAIEQDLLSIKQLKELCLYTKNGC